MTEQRRIVILFGVILGCIIGLSNAQIVYRGKCKKSPVQQDFNVTRFAGTWHEVSRSFMFFQLLMRCVETDYTVKDQGVLEIKIRGIDTIGIKRTYEGTAQMKDPSNPAKYKAKFRIMPMSVNYYVLKTDYDSYAVMWSCNNLLGGRLGHTENMWLLSRTPILKDETLHQIYQFLDSNNVRRQFLERNARQNKCPSNYTSANQTETATTTTIPPTSTTSATNGSETNTTTQIYTNGSETNTTTQIYTTVTDSIELKKGS